MAAEGINANNIPGLPPEFQPPEGLSQEEFSAWLLGKQAAMQRDSQMFSTMSNIMNMRHQMVMGSMEKVGQSGRG